MTHRSAREVLVDYTTKLSENNPSSENTGTFVDGSMQPGGQVTGSYGHTIHSEEPDLMRTPLVPNENDAAGIVDNVKVSGLLHRKLATPQPVVPDPEMDEPGRTQPVGNLTPGAQRAAPPLLSQDDPSSGENIGRMGGALAGNRAQEIIGSPHIEMPEEENLKQLLRQMQEQNPDFYAERAEEKQAAAWPDTEVKKQRALWEKNTKNAKPRAKPPSNLVHIPSKSTASKGKGFFKSMGKTRLGKGLLIGGAGLGAAGAGAYGLKKYLDHKGEK